MRFFQHPPEQLEELSQSEAKPVEETEKLIKDQRRESEATLVFVKQVLRRKDELLAEAVNQTGEGLRRRPRRYNGGIHH